MAPIQYIGSSRSYRPDRPIFTRGNERSIITSVYNRIALDVSSVSIQHVRLDEDGRFTETLSSALNDRFSLEANIDQTGRAFVQDIVMSMLDEGCVAIAPVDTDIDPDNGTFKIESIRTGKILEWYPRHVKIRVYNDQTGEREDVIVPKNTVAIVENPFYAVMNEHNSTMQRLIRKLNILDAIDEQSSSGKLNLIIQLPYVIKTEARRQQAENRRKDIEEQLASSKFGVAYTDGTEHVVQLNRPVENNLMSQIEYLTSMLYSQLGLTQSIMDGTADEKTMQNYMTRTIEPILAAIVDEMKRKFLTKTARSQKQSILFFRDPFNLVPVGSIAEIADKMTRNEIMTSNEIRQKIGLAPSRDPKADELRNSDLSAPKEEPTDNTTQKEDEVQNGSYPDEWEACDGSIEIAPGVTAGQQTRKVFGLSYRTLIGNDVDGSDHGYKIHLVYGAQASPSGRDHGTVNESPEPTTMSWEATTTPVEVPGGKNSAHLVIDSTKTSAEKLTALETILYGADEAEARLPMPSEIIELMNDEAAAG